MGEGKKIHGGDYVLLGAGSSAAAAAAVLDARSIPISCSVIGEIIDYMAIGFGMFVKRTGVYRRPYQPQADASKVLPNEAIITVPLCSTETQLVMRIAPMTEH